MEPVFDLNRYLLQVARSYSRILITNNPQVERRQRQYRAANPFSDLLRLYWILNSTSACLPPGLPASLTTALLPPPTIVMMISDISQLRGIRWQLNSQGNLTNSAGLKHWNEDDDNRRVAYSREARSELALRILTNYFLLFQKFGE